MSQCVFAEYNFGESNVLLSIYERISEENTEENTGFTKCTFKGAPYRNTGMVG